MRPRPRRLLRGRTRGGGRRRAGLFSTLRLLLLSRARGERARARLRPGTEFPREGTESSVSRVPPLGWPPARTSLWYPPSGTSRAALASRQRPTSQQIAFPGGLAASGAVARVTRIRIRTRAQGLRGAGWEAAAFEGARGGADHLCAPPREEVPPARPRPRCGRRRGGSAVPRPRTARHEAQLLSATEDL